MIEVVTWKWGTQFGPEYVNRLASMLRRHLHIPYRFNVITDDVIGIDDGQPTRIIPMMTEHAEMTAGNRACFRRLQIFSRDMAERIGPRILQLDLDTVFVDDVTPLFDRPESLMLVEQNRIPGHRRVTYNPSMLLMDAGVLHALWDKFHADPKQTWYDAKAHGWACSDMSVINDYLDMHTDVPRATWTVQEGVVSWWREIEPKQGILPAGARAVLFYGSQNPSDPAIQERAPWIEEHWR